MRNERNKTISDEMCIQVTKCTPFHYSTEKLWTDSVSSRVIGPLFVLGLTIMISTTSERDVTQASTQIAAILNFLLPFAVYGLGVIGIKLLAKLFGRLNQFRGAAAQTPTIRTLLLFIILSFPFAIFLEIGKLQLFGTEVNYSRAAWTSVMLVLCWEAFAAYLVRNVFTPATSKFEPLQAFSDTETPQKLHPILNDEAQPNRPRLCVTGCKPLPLSQSEAWYYFWRPEFSLPAALICICVSMGLVIAFSMNGRAWHELALLQLILCASFLVLCVLSYMCIASFVTAASARKPQKHRPVNIYSISFLLPIAYAAGFVLELAQVIIYGQPAIDVSRMIIMGTIFTLIAEACASYYVNVAVPLTRANLMVKSQGSAPSTGRTEPLADNQKPTSQASAFVNLSQSQSAIGETTPDQVNSSDPPPAYPPDDYAASNLLLCVTGCKPFAFSYQEAWASFRMPEFFLPQVFVGLCIAAGLGMSAPSSSQPLMAFALLQLVLILSGMLAGILLYVGYGWIVTKSAWSKHWKSSPPRIYSLAIIIPICLAFAGANELNRTIYTPEETFQITRILQQSVIFVIVGELTVIYLVKLAIPLIRSKRQLRNEKFKSQSSPDATDTSGEEPNSSNGIKLLKIRDRAIPADDLVMLNAEGNYIRVFEKENSWLTNGPLFEILDSLGFDGGIQIHRSTWVALNACKDVKRRERKLYVVLNDDTQVRIARGREKAVTDAITAHSKTRT